MKLNSLTIFILISNYTFGQNVGIGVAAPTERLEINQKLKISNGNLNNLLLKADGVSTQIEFNEGATNQVRLFETGGGFGISTLGNISHMKWWPNGNITTAAGSTLKLDGTGNEENVLILKDENPKIEMSVLGTERGYLQQLGVNLFVGTPFSNTLGFLGFNTQNITRAVIDKEGNFGIATNSPKERLHVIGNGIFNFSNPIIQLQNSSIDKGFMQLNGDDLRIGTNSGNTAGNVVIRNDGADILTFRKTGTGGSWLQLNSNGTSTGVIQATDAGTLSISNPRAGEQLQLGGEIYIDNTNNHVGIGTSNPTERLHVNGNEIVTGNSTINGNENVGGNIQLNGKLTTVGTTSSYNLLPVCYGRVAANGNKIGGTPNFTVSKPCINGSPGCYWINSPQITASSIIIINVDSWLVSSSSSLFATYHYQGNGDMGVYIHDEAGDPTNSNFNFVIFDP